MPHLCLSVGIPFWVIIMKIPLSWLNEYVDISSIPVGQLVERLTIAGLEVESVRLIGKPKPDDLNVKIEEEGPVWDEDKIRIAKILRVEPHPDADKLKLPIITFGDGEEKQLVTGAPNISIGDENIKVVVALEGSVLFDGHSEVKKLSKLKPTKIRGIPSDAMVCSEYELGITEEHEGIILLPDDAPVGESFMKYAGDIVLNADVLPNMARCLSMIGVAREVAALTGKALKMPTYDLKADGDPVEGQVRVRIEDSKLSARYTAMLLKNVTIGKSPEWMRRRLLYAGMRPVNNVVDVTNYVMLEWGQPLHAFDLDKLLARAGDKPPVITVRPAKKNEKLTTLDDIERKLTPDHLLITDEAGPIALAGVKGGAETEVSEESKNILLESASFNGVSIRKTSHALGIPSEASMRFSRGVHPETVQPAAERASLLMQQHASAKVSAGIVDTYPAPISPQVTELSMSKVKRVLGVEISLEEATRILQTLEFKVEKQNDDTLSVTTPSHRLDVQEGAADLIEELGRIYGYDRMTPTLLAEPLPRQRGNLELELEERVRDLLVSMGLQESITYSLTTAEREARLNIPKAKYVELKNPISDERSVLRHSVLWSLLEVLGYNLKYTHDVRTFEIGRVYLPRSGAKLPDEPRRLAIVLTGTHDIPHWQTPTDHKPQPLDFFDLKGVIEGLVNDLHLSEVSFRPSVMNCLHPKCSADLFIGKTNVGGFGQLHPRIAASMNEIFDLNQDFPETFVAELDLDALLETVPSRHGYQRISRFEVVKQDIALIVDKNVTAEQVLTEIRAAGGELLREATLFDVYTGESIEEGKKSLAYALVYQSAGESLSDKQVGKVHKKIEGRLRHQLKAQIRGSDAK